MRNFKYNDEVFLGILLIIAIVLILVANGNNVLVGCGCVALGLAVLEISWIVKKKADKEMFNFAKVYKVPVKLFRAQPKNEKFSKKAITFDGIEKIGKDNLQIFMFDSRH